MINIVPIIFSAFIFTNGWMRPSKSRVGSDGFFHFFSLLVLIFTGLTSQKMTTPCPNVGNFRFACVKNPKMRWILVGKRNLPQCPRPTRDASDCSCCNCFCQPPGWQKNAMYYEHWLKKCFIVLGNMQRRRCSLTLCKAMYKTHGASTACIPSTVCPRLQVLPPPWHQVIGNSEPTRGKSPSMNGSGGNEVQGWCFLSVISTVLLRSSAQKKQMETKKNMG